MHFPYPFVPDVKYGISLAQLSTFSLKRENSFDVGLQIIERAEHSGMNLERSIFIVDKSSIIVDCSRTVMDKSGIIVE